MINAKYRLQTYQVLVSRPTDGNPAGMRSSEREFRKVLGMRKSVYFFTAAASLLCAGSASAATLLSAEIIGPDSGGVWDTQSTGARAPTWTLFLQSPGLGNFLNPADNFGGQVITSTTQDLLAAEGFGPGTLNSDSRYILNLVFAEGFSLTGSYTPGSPNAFLGGSSVNYGGSTYSLNEFSFTRSLQDSVQQHVAIPGGNSADYSGNFVVGVTPGAVPEPATWAMMLFGFGAVGFSLRRRKTNASAKRIRLALA